MSWVAAARVIRLYDNACTMTGQIQGVPASQNKMIEGFK
ncbi:BZ3500_MvSof-1268-A1-R1_Chr8-1g09751 [Microbotryum saponariae]|uniref:BZ3500_MvSof-1268-A1-R1_Chr8-1g09751 protein n=1 Tax=Microbotryum saponariae TaxID=289078 RepID=A0A2X0NQC1_9BASI|nr:BZ3500_MvSof-1268-A1-R1_Chr8-1g09751 [Microbotryum saponariae]SDA08037.1 BZ3501_MvSof-1269-A2-R1_Chr8-1g09474 [Microbotryum saponariae]